MSSVDDAFQAAQHLNTEEKLILIARIEQSIPPQSEFRPSDEDLAEIRRRGAEIDAGTAQTISWEVVRDEVRAKLARHD